LVNDGFYVLVEQSFYTELVGGSNPSPRTIFRLNEAQTEEPASNTMPIMNSPGRINTRNNRKIRPTLNPERPTF